MQLSDETTAPVITRLKRVHGQLAGIIRMLEEGRDCESVVHQIAAASRALDRAGIHLLSSGLKECILADGDYDTAEMEKLFLTLA